jgi:hypothetical protein
MGSIAHLGKGASASASPPPLRIEDQDPNTDWYAFCPRRRRLGNGAAFVGDAVRLPARA